MSTPKVTLKDRIVTFIMATILGFIGLIAFAAGGIGSLAGVILAIFSFLLYVATFQDHNKEQDEEIRS